ncbi:MAG: MerC domain-containing protein [Acidobacteriota bacterium]
MKASTLDIRKIADGLGIVGSAACALHCITIPVLLVLGATVPTMFLTDESFHTSMLWLVVPSAVVAFALGCRRHKDRWVLLLGAVGVVGMVLSGTALHDLAGETVEKLVTVASAALLITAHWRNFKLCRADSCPS